MTPPLIVIAAGGTGGHVFPAISLGRQLIDRGYRVVLLTDTRVQNLAEISDGEFEQIVLPVRRLGRRPGSLFIGSVGLVGAYFKAWRLIGKLRPAAVIGFGGYPSLPPLIAAGHRRVPTVIHEQNAVLGRTNRFLARHADAVALSFAVTDRPDWRRGRRSPEHTHLVGNPVRSGIEKRAGSDYSAPQEDDAFRILVTGGSQGASVFAELLPQAFAQLAEPLRRRLSVVQQCRPEDLNAVRESYAALGIAAELSPFFEEMANLIAGAHLVICRSGASTVAEITTIGRPAIFLPYPHATNDHQRANAATVVKSGGGWLMDQAITGPEELAGQIEYLMAEPCALATAA
ncbi:MAG: undecaprenyldiphospho-muramoylpentapeptide beta-N-acetylglucosaminyltransferase, partial [Alphaproteobacteria bacterium]|nr:undecaprenyldiphospho-muramoylpentapeptide beta-N-acetylglucosaminyltransferase [Alphaproteobacteria bacterium]